MMTLKNDTPRSTAELALGRILRMASRPAQSGDIAEYERCRAIILSAFDEQPIGYRPSWARDGASARARGE